MPGNNNGPKVLRSLSAEYLQTDRVELRLLKGDGSDRVLYRIVGGGRSIIGVHHADIRENRNFFALTELFRRCRIPAPKLLSVGSGASDYLLEDLGDVLLADIVGTWRGEKREKRIVSAYRQVIDCLIRMQSELSERLLSLPFCRKMDRRLYLDDLRLFKECFIDLYGFEVLYTSRVERELEENLIEAITNLDHSFFVFRDFQSRNVMWQHGRPVFIDYQSACLGTEYYDLASVLYGAKSGLEERERRELLEYFFRRKKKRADYADFLHFFYRFVLARRLRSFGSYGYLAEKKGKRDFKSYVLPALDELKALFSHRPQLDEFPHTCRMIAEIRTLWPSSVA